MTRRDKQQWNVYDAEKILVSMFDNAEKSNNRMVELEGAHITLPAEYKFASIENAQDYCNAVTKRKDIPGVSVREVRSDSWAFYQCHGIALPNGRDRWAMREIVVLHELAHHMAIGHGHDETFMAAFIQLLHEMMGPEVGFALSLICAHGKVKIK